MGLGQPAHGTGPPAPGAAVAAPGAGGLGHAERLHANTGIGMQSLNMLEIYKVHRVTLV